MAVVSMMTKLQGDQTLAIGAIADFMRGHSIEATRPSDEEVAALATIAAAGTMVYVSAVPTHPPESVVESAIRLRRAGFEPVPHVAVRTFATATALDRHLARLTAEAGVRRVLVIGGDKNPPAGSLRSAIEVIDSGLLQRRNIFEIGIAGYPEGHPQIAESALERALIEKIAAAEAVGLKVHIVTQFCFDAGPIMRWIQRLRDFGLENPVRIGLAGPTSLSRLMRFAARCGVRASAQGLARHAGLLRNLFVLSAPDAVVRELATGRKREQLGDAAPHLFSFGGLVPTSRWAAAVSQGKIALEAGQGFRLEPAG